MQVEFDPPCQVRTEPNIKSLLPVEGEPGAHPRTFVAEKTNLLAYALTWPTETKTAKVRIGVAADPWKTLVKSGPSGRHLGFPPHLQFAISEPVEKADGCVVANVAYRWSGDMPDVRLIAVDASGREHVCANIGRCCGRPRGINGHVSRFAAEEHQAFLFANPALRVGRVPQRVAPCGRKDRFAVARTGFHSGRRERKGAVTPKWLGRWPDKHDDVAAVVPGLRPSLGKVTPLWGTHR